MTTSSGDDGGTFSGDEGAGEGAPFVEGMTARGKYFRLEVPNFNASESEQEQMSSYLHLGAVRDLALAASPSAPKATGEDLAGLVTTFIDDTRKRDVCPDFLTEAVRQAETAKLHTKGGWRDHSDGNRITTTRGDKVEVIKGNYKMLILGRQDDQAGWDVSGGHVSQSGITFAGSSSIEWTQNYDGTWKVVEETVKGDVWTTYMGDTHDVYTGNIKDSRTGSPAPSATQPNPIITDQTWALSITSSTGSAALPIPTITDDTFAGAITSTTTAASITDTTTCPAITSTTIGNTVSTTIGNTLDTTVGLTTSIIVGAEAEIVVGNMSEVTVGLEESVTVGGVIDVSVAARLEVNVSTGFEFTVGGLTELNPAHKDEIATMKNQLSMMKNELTLTKQAIGAIYEDFHGIIMLG